MQIGLSSSSSKELVEINLRFEAYKDIHGDLFEDAFVPLTEHDKAEVLARRKRFSNIFWIVYGMVMVGVGLGLALGKTPDDEDYYFIISFVVFPLIFRMMMMNAFNKALKNNEKRVIHGVVTRKEIKGKNAYIEFSRRLKIKMAAVDYRILNLGEIVRMELLANVTLIKRKVVVEGRI